MSNALSERRDEEKRAVRYVKFLISGVNIELDHVRRKIDDIVQDIDENPSSKYLYNKLSSARKEFQSIQQKKWELENILKCLSRL